MIGYNWEPDIGYYDPYYYYMDYPYDYYDYYDLEPYRDMMPFDPPMEA